MMMGTKLRVAIAAASLLAVGAFLPALSRYGISSVKQALLMTHTDSADSHAADSGAATRRAWLSDAAVAMPTAAALLAALGSQPELAVAASAGGLPPSGYFLQHAVLNVNNMDANVKFWCQGLGMQVVRKRTLDGVTTVFVGYGKETLSTGSDGFFSLELVPAPKPVFGAGSSFQYIGLTLPDKLIAIALKATDAGGDVVPHWFAEKDFLELKSPEGISVRVKRGQRHDPVTTIALGVNNAKSVKSYLKDTWHMQEQGGLLKALGPLAGDDVLTYDAGAVSITLVRQDKPVSQGQVFDKVAVLTRDTVALSDAVKATSFAKVLYVGEAPGIGTKVANTIDKEYHDIVAVDYTDFEKELV